MLLSVKKGMLFELGEAKRVSFLLASQLNF